MNIYRGMNKKKYGDIRPLPFFGSNSGYFFVELGIMVALENWIHLSEALKTGCSTPAY